MSNEPNEARPSERPASPDAEQVARTIQPVILGADYSAYAFVRCFWEAYQARSIILGNFDVKSISRTKYADYRVTEGIDNADRLLEVLAELGEQLCTDGKLPFLVTCGDFYARIVSENKAQLERWFYTPVSDFGVLDFITQKKNFYETCEEVGLDYPKTLYLDCSNPDGTVDDGGFRYPVVAKPSNSAAYHYAEFPGKQKVFYAQSREELEGIYRALQQSCYDESLIVQEFIPGGDDELFAIYAYVDANSDPVFAICGHVGLEDHHPGAIGNAVAIVPEENPQLEADVARFLKHIGYRGMCCFDVKRDPRDGRYKFLEMNARPGRSSWLVLLAGINFAKIMVDEVVLGIRPAAVRPSTDWAYVGVPRRVIAKYMRPGEFKERLLKAYDSGKASFALGGKGESLSQRLWSGLNYWNQVRKFARYCPLPEDSERA